MTAESDDGTSDIMEPAYNPVAHHNLMVMESDDGTSDIMEWPIGVYITWLLPILCHLTVC